MTPLPQPTGPVPSLTEDPYIPGSGEAGIVPEHYDLDLSVRLATNRLTGVAKIRGVVPETTDTFRFDLVGLSVKKASLKGGTVSKVKSSRERVTLQTKQPVAAGSRIEFTISYEGVPAPRRGLWGEVGWEELTDGVLVAGQPNGAPTWFPCVDHPSLKSTYRIAVWADAGYRVIANGRLVDTARKGSSHRWVYDEPHPMSTYLAALQIGRYDVVEHAGPVGFAATNLSARKARLALDDQPAMFALFERCFGPYPFDSYTSVVSDDVLEIPLEAMEMSLFGINHMTKTWENQRLVAHEMAHQWWGNSVTLARWQDLWLHEGFACYAEWLWSEEAGLGTAASRARTAWLGLRHKPQDLILRNPGPADMFDDRVYKRGALVLHTLRVMAGDEAFFGLLREFQSRYTGRTATTEDFTQLALERCGALAAAEIEPWLSEPLVPAFRPAL